jgi:hypothetical protein
MMSTLPVISTATPAAEPASGGWVRKHPLLAMYVLMFALAWAVLVPQALASRGVLSFQMPMALSFVAGWSPAIATLVVTGLVDGRGGVGSLLRRFLVVRVGVQWYVVALSLIAVAIPGGIGLHVLTGGAMPVIPALHYPFTTVLFAFVVTLVLGYLFNISAALGKEGGANSFMGHPYMQADHQLMILRQPLPVRLDQIIHQLPDVI